MYSEGNIDAVGGFKYYRNLVDGVWRARYTILPLRYLVITKAVNNLGDCLSRLSGSRSMPVLERIVVVHNPCQRLWL